MEKKIITSHFLSLQKRDFVRGLIVAAITPVITIITTSIDKGDLVFNWKAIGFTAISAGLAYILKNLFEPSKTIIVNESSK